MGLLGTIRFASQIAFSKGGIHVAKPIRKQHKQVCLVVSLRMSAFLPRWLQAADDDLVLHRRLETSRRRPKMFLVWQPGCEATQEVS